MFGWLQSILKDTNFYNNKILTKENLKNATIIGDTLDDDQIIFYNGNYFIYSWQVTILIINVGNKLKDVFKWYASGEYWEAINFKTFTPFISWKTASPLYNHFFNFNSEYN